MNILIGVTGGIAAYKTIYLARLFIKNGDNVKVILTQEAEHFVTALTFEVLTKNKVLTDSSSVGSISHIDLAEWADICIVAPATANTIAKIACGIADNPLTTTMLALTVPVLIAPSMNTKMYQNIATQDNICKLKSRGFYFIEPSVGLLACGDNGAGKLPEPDDIFARTLEITNSKIDDKILEGIRIIVTGGGTIEAIDPVRYLSNKSSGKMGYALATVARDLGADVTFIAGNSDSSLVFEKMVKVSSADEMYLEIKKIIGGCDILIMTAAVADYKAERVADQKIKKDGDTLELKLVKNIDILTALAEDKKATQVFIGFAAESFNLDKNAQEKLARKSLDMIAANDISRTDIGFNSDDNEIKLFFKNGRVSSTGKRSKSEIAKIILTEAAIELSGKKSTDS